MSPFGASCSPFILNCVIKKHLQSHPPTISSDIEANIYKDNLIAGCNSTAEAMEYYSASRSIFQQASLSLLSWASNQRSYDSRWRRGLLPFHKGSRFVLESRDRHPTRTHCQFITLLRIWSDQTRCITWDFIHFYPFGFIVQLSIPARILFKEIWKIKLD